MFFPFQSCELEKRLFHTYRLPQSLVHELKTDFFVNKTSVTWPMGEAYALRKDFLLNQILSR